MQAKDVYDNIQTLLAMAAVDQEFKIIKLSDYRGGVVSFFIQLDFTLLV